MVELSPLRERLAREMRGARTSAGLNQHELAKRLSVSQRTVSRVETGERLPERAMAETWLAALSEDDRERVLLMVDAAHVETRRWDALRDGEGSLQGIAASEEEVATHGRIYVTSYLPGLLQTAAYTRALVPLVDPGADLGASVAGRMRRQERLADESREFEFLIGEPALLWAPASGVMGAQRMRLASVATLPNVEMRVLPVARVGPIGWHDFSIWEAPDVPSWVSIEMRHGGAVVAEPDAVSDYVKLWEHLWAAAVQGDEAVAMLTGGGAP